MKLANSDHKLCQHRVEYLPSPLAVSGFGSRLCAVSDHKFCYNILGVLELRLSTQSPCCFSSESVLMNPLSLYATDWGLGLPGVRCCALAE